MAIPFEASSRSVPFTAPLLLNQTRATFEDFPDRRKTKTSNNLKYAVADAAMSAFSVFFTQSPSFLDYQERMRKKHGKCNAQSILGVPKLPSMNQVRNLLDPVSPTARYPLFQEINDELYHNGYLDSYRSLNGSLLLAIDATDCFSSEEISYPGCTQQTLKNGQTLYRHIAVTPVIVAPGKSDVIPLPPEFVEPQDGHEKPDCELAAAKRWLTAWGALFALEYHDFGRRLILSPTLLRSRY